jgi:hypothetical protein
MAFRLPLGSYCSRAQAVVHELLHSLGLGENPPTSREITAQVLKRCRT